MQLCPPSRHSIPLWSKYSTQHPVLKHLQFMLTEELLERESSGSVLETDINGRKDLLL
jgi:hypothetical protein